jgi:hypothetical protein
MTDFVDPDASAREVDTIFRRGPQPLFQCLLEGLRRTVRSQRHPLSPPKGLRVFNLCKFGLCHQSAGESLFRGLAEQIWREPLEGTVIERTSRGSHGHCAVPRSILQGYIGIVEQETLRDAEPPLFLRRCTN